MSIYRYRCSLESTQLPVTSRVAVAESGIKKRATEKAKEVVKKGCCQDFLKGFWVPQMSFNKALQKFVCINLTNILTLKGFPLTYAPVITGI